MDFGLDDHTTKLRSQLLDFMQCHVYPAEPTFHDELDSLPDRWAWSTAPVLQKLRGEAKERGLWNLFLPGQFGARPAWASFPQPRSALPPTWRWRSPPTRCNCSAGPATPRFSGRAVHARRRDHPDLRGHQPDPACGDGAGPAALTAVIRAHVTTKCRDRVRV
jgi:hypothetical protein